MKSNYPVLSRVNTSLIATAAIFSMILVYFCLGSAWYESTRLVISGQAVHGNAMLEVRWNSGQGFNSYEQRVFNPYIQSSDGKQTHTVIIGAAGKKNGASLSKKVVCSAIIIDGKHLELSSFADQVEYAAGSLHFDDYERITLKVQATSHIGVQFKTNTYSGFGYLSINGVESRHDLYIANVEAKDWQFDYWLLQPDGVFRVEMDLPRYRIRELEILSQRPNMAVQLRSVQIYGQSEVVDLLNTPTGIGSVQFDEILTPFKRFFQPGQLVQQVLFALLTTWLLIALFRYYRKTGGVHACFMQKERYIFWGMFAACLTVFGAWLIAFWPGVMSIDSLKVWRAAMLPDVYLNDHPVLNVFLYKYLFQLYGSPVVVALAQVILTALLISWFWFWLYLQGVSFKLLAPCLVFILCSVPVGVYTVTLWKDIPFALLVVFWGCT
jgi:hypothetical protein